MLSCFEIYEVIFQLVSRIGGDFGIIFIRCGVIIVFGIRIRCERKVICDLHKAAHLFHELIAKMRSILSNCAY